MKKYILLLTAFMGTGNIMASPQLSGAEDSLSVRKTYYIDEVVVTGTRHQTDVRHLSQTVSVVNRNKLERAMQPSLLPVLTEQVPGLFVTSRGVMGYGVSGGAAGGISLRGLSGGNARLMVLIDGHPQYAGIFGHPISDTYQTLLADRVEVLRGPASVLYGSNAMGGVINIVTRRMHEDGVQTSLHAGFGSYGTLETELTNRVRKGRFSLVISGSYNRTDGHRADMAFEQYGGYAKLGYELTDNWNVRGDVNVTHFNASYPGPVSAPLLDGDQHITRGMTSFALENDYGKTSGALSFFYNWGDHWINDGYTPSEGEGPQDDRFNSFDNMMGLSLYQSTRFFKGNRITFGFDWFRYGGHAWSEYVSGENAGTSSDIVDKHEDEVAGYVDFRQDFGRWLTLNAGLRVDHHSRVGTERVPQAGLAFHLPHAIELKASASKGFRYPILREMYMFPPQNPDLQPESMWNYELAFSQQLLDGRLQYGVNLFYIDGKNLIQTLPNPNGSGMLNQNSGRIYNSGVELQTAYRINKDWSVDANYSFLHMENPVIAAPEHKLYAGAAFSKGRWNVSSGVQYIAGLYTAVGATETTEDFVLWNLRASFRAAKWLDIWARGENLLAQRYEINAGYPMPRATVMGGMNIHF
ncbi:tonB dependent receptor family protein [Bacteroides fragilis str. 3976T8]|uniref:TonB dependent receptor family protein n=1 Tax=Bacteroides fragilis str. 3976T8 TaxID=1339314 RepID=A0A016CJ43_BACFG|nr:TonB-dependent receptor [Bacteroides fragilis]EXZ71419.1 tonB dependent receptor family protein [Bacteroides fragilis str. 3976T8]